MAVDFSTLSDLQFVETDAETILTEIISGYEEASGTTLQPASPVRLFLDTIASIIVMQRNLIDWSAKQNLLAYATGDYLDHLGALVGVSRIPATASVTTLEFTLSAVQKSAVTVPAGTRATTDGTIVWATDETLTIGIGETSGTVTATCTTTGESGNDYTAGQIETIIDPVAYVASVTNTTTTSNGSDTESDDNLRERIRLAPESFSVAGSKGAYEFWAKSASSSIIDVCVTSDEGHAGEVFIYPLMTDGELPTDDILELVYNACNADEVRPLTDYVHVLAPETVEYQTEMTYYIAEEDESATSTIQSAVEEAVADYELWQRSKIGRDINPSKLIQKIISAGALRVEVTSPTYTELAENQLAIPSASAVITYGGLEVG